MTVKRDRLARIFPPRLEDVSTSALGAARVKSRVQEQIRIERRNVVPFARLHRDGRVSAAPLLTVALLDRKPSQRPRQDRRFAAFLAASFIAHTALFTMAMMWTPAPKSSVGEIVISLELIPGADTPAGLAPMPSEAEAQIPSPTIEGETTTPETPKGNEETPPVVEETSQMATEVKPVEPEMAPTADPEVASQPTPAESTEAPEQQADATKAEQPGSTEVAASEAEPPTAPQPADSTPEAAVESLSPSSSMESPPPSAPEPAIQQSDEPLPPTVQPSRSEPAAAALYVETPRPRPHEAEKMPARKPDRAPAPRKPTAGKRDGTRDRPAPSVATAAASGIGRGRSDADTNYRGLVVAHLARHKQYPPDARRQGIEGSAAVRFTIDGGGRVTSVALARGAGAASLDQETLAMVRRASPFPPPPSGRAMSFTAPVSFHIR